VIEAGGVSVQRKVAGKKKTGSEPEKTPLLINTPSNRRCNSQLLFAGKVRPEGWETTREVDED